MDRLVKEAIEISPHMNKINREKDSNLAMHGTPAPGY
jgi:hypothetical protein